MARSYQFERAIYEDHLIPRWDELFGSFPLAEQDEAKHLIKRKVSHLDSIIACWHDWQGDRGEAIRSYKRSFKRFPMAAGNLYRFARSLIGLKVPPPGVH
jgi:hypothetical protein